MTDDNDILIDEHGNIRFVYSDLLDSVFSDEPRETKRASHVEPHPTLGGWVADMSPVGGPQLVASGIIGEIGPITPFATRTEALAAEREWLRRNHNL